MFFEKLGKLATSEKVGLIVALVFAFAFVVDRWVVREVVNRCRRLDVAIRTAECNVIDDQGTLSKRKRVLEEYSGIKDVLGKVSSRDEAIAALKGEVDDLARRTGVSVLSMEHREPVPTESGSCEVYSVVVGGFESETRSLVAFLAEVQKSPGMLRVDKMNLGPGKGRDSVKGSLRITKVMVLAED